MKGGGIRHMHALELHACVYQYYVQNLAVAEITLITAVAPLNNTILLFIHELISALHDYL